MAEQNGTRRVLIDYQSLAGNALYVLLSERKIGFVSWETLQKYRKALMEINQIGDEKVRVGIDSYTYSARRFFERNRHLLHKRDDGIILRPEVKLPHVVNVICKGITIKEIMALRQVEDVVLEGVPQYSKTIPPTSNVVLYYLKATGYSTQALVRQGVSVNEVEDFFANRIPISKGMANAIYKLVSKYPGIDADYWMRYDSEYRVPINYL